MGIALMFIAILLIQPKATHFKLDPSVLAIIFSAALFAVFQVSSASVSQTLTTGTYLVIAYGGAALITVLFSIKQLKNDYKKITVELKNATLKTLFASGTSLLYFLFSYLAYRSAPDRGKVVVLLTSQVVLSVLFGIIFLRETENKTKKVIAGILAFIASILIKA
jgi:drug/metabolite transporter (DMT)-like permease